MLDEDVFRFLNVTAKVRHSSWDDPSLSRLWRYNLHYFDDLTAQGAADRAAWHQSLIGRWVRENPPGTPTAWEPYPTSLRMVNWIKWSIASRGRGLRGLEPDAEQSLASQTRWLSRRLETHILGNHLWANAKALVFAGAYFEGGEADRWLRRGTRLIEHELHEQILADGGHYERSPMYHATVLEDVLDLLNLARLLPGLTPVGDALRRVVPHMLRWLRVMTHPDGHIAFFNDAAFGVAPDLAALEAYAAGLGLSTDTEPLGAVEALPDSGYIRLCRGKAVVICDVAPIGPNYQPGHAHADTLSFELSLGQRRVLVNGGTSTYEPGVERQRQRGTGMHNTVQVDGLDSSEVWSAFRVARRARPSAVRWGEDGNTVWATGAHDGYDRLPRRTIHRRRWLLSATELRVEDELLGRFREAVAAFRFHPSMARDEIITVLPDPPVNVEREISSWHPEFGTSEPTVVLKLRVPAGRLTTTIRWR